MNFFKKVSLKEYVSSVLLSIPFALISILGYFTLAPTMLLVVSLGMFCFALNFLIRVTNKIGIAVLFFFTYSLLTFNVPDVGVIGFRKVLTFIIAGLLLEIIIFLLKKRMKLKTFIGTVIAITALPMIAALLISASLTITFPEGLINLILVCLITSVVSTLLYIVIWHIIKVKKPLIKLKSYLGSLNQH